ncbi:50S ribosomal protein L2 [bacterium]|nr:50S ribosomal protein L2 [bacterium]
MGTKKFKPVTPILRFKVISDFSEITKSYPEKNLLRPLKKTGGRNNRGVVTSRHRGGGHKRRYRIIDFKRNKQDTVGKIEGIEYDPNRSSNIALVLYRDGERRYVLAPLGIKVGDEIISSENAPISVGNCLPLKRIPIGVKIHNIEFQPNKGGQLARSAGDFGTITGLDESGRYVYIKLPSGEVRAFNKDCRATIGQIGNADHSNIVYGKAGGMRWLGKKPRVRGVAMNPVDHPHGGGEGKSKGYKQPVSPWGQPSKGFKTRKNKKQSDKYILKKRK